MTAHNRQLCAGKVITEMFLKLAVMSAEQLNYSYSFLLSSFWFCFFPVPQSPLCSLSTTAANTESSPCVQPPRQVMRLQEHPQSTMYLLMQFCPFLWHRIILSVFEQRHTLEMLGKDSINNFQLAWLLGSDSHLCLPEDLHSLSQVLHSPFAPKKRPTACFLWNPGLPLIFIS